MPHSPVLDLHGLAAEPYFVIAPEVAAVGGYQVEVERRLVDGRAAAAARFTTPDGRVLNVCFRPSTNRVLKPKSLVEDITCEVAAKVFAKMSAADEVEVARRIGAAVEAGFAALVEGVTGDKARSLMQVASLCLPEDVVTEYQRHLPVQANLFTVARLRDAGVPPEHAAEFTLYRSERDGAWLRKYRKGSDYVGFGAYAKHGWSVTEFDEVRQFWDRWNGGSRASYPPVRWATLPPNVVTLALRANMSFAEVRKLVDRGEWDDDAVRTMIALSSPA